MFTAIILMCSTELQCYSIVNKIGVFDTEEQCKSAIVELVSSKDFSDMYMNVNGKKMFDIFDAKCINWNGVKA